MQLQTAHHTWNCLFQSYQGWLSLQSSCFEQHADALLSLAYSSSHFTLPLNTVLDRLFSLQGLSGIDLAVGSGFSWCSNWSSVLHSMFLLMVWCSREKIGQRQGEREWARVCVHRGTNHRQGRDLAEEMFYAPVRQVLTRVLLCQPQHWIDSAVACCHKTVVSTAKAKWCGFDRLYFQDKCGTLAQVVFNVTHFMCMCSHICM